MTELNSAPNNPIESVYVAKGAVVAATAKHDYQWHHYDLSDDSAIQALKNDSSIPEFARLALVDSASRPRVEIEDNSVLVILRGANLNTGADQHDMISIRIVAEPNRLITAQFRHIKTTSDFLSRAKNGKPQKSVATLLAKLISALFQQVEQTVMQLADAVDELEETIDDGNLQNTRDQIANLRRQVVVFKRHLQPQREVSSRLRYSNIQWLEEQHSNLHAENYERIMRNIDELEEMRDKLTIIKEEVQTILSERLNRNTYVLSIVAAIFLPLGFLTGLLGINIAGIPGADYPLAFWVFCTGLVIIVALQIYIMRKNKWF